ncbi:toxin-antitoxin system TumE family protein [Kumtagia ephedrae]|uniref:Uncharacterized protein n=1 Tax=Kumtagia ephedrae TaxID=2116701 RepID=A0A2P7S228_9HYPH|nr:DUF6516 family protein [Mesorhizobium ephedrae]PSJ56527.1 hypothetical protein C7I84_20365 [Mesorhizobium ephedrae]
MAARLIVRERVVYPDGDIVEMVVWMLPEPVPPTTHGFKYRLVYIREGQRVLACDNERGKGDHRHFRGEESAIRFLSIEALLEAFVAEVEQMRGDR